MRAAEYSVRFERDLRLAEKRGKDIAKLKRLIALLVVGEPLPRMYGDHPLKGKWIGYRDAHIESDWVLIYKLVGERFASSEPALTAISSTSKLLVCSGRAIPRGLVRPTAVTASNPPEPAASR